MDIKFRIYVLAKKIPKGRVSTYGIIARKARTSSRAVGQIMKRNPYKSVPCHRVVMSDGSIGGFRGNHSDEKQSILRKEGIKIKKGKIENFKKILYRF